MLLAETPCHFRLLINLPMTAPRLNRSARSPPYTTVHFLRTHLLRYLIKFFDTETHVTFT